MLGIEKKNQYLYIFKFNAELMRNKLVLVILMAWNVDERTEN